MNRLCKIFAVLLLSIFSVFPIFAQESTDDMTGQDIKTMTVQQVADYYKLDINAYITQLKSTTNVSQIEPESSFQLLHDNFGLTPSLAKDIAVAMVAQNQGDENALTNLQIEIEKESKSEKDYYFPLIGVTLVFMYLGSLWLVHQKKLSLIIQRKIWNVSMASFFFVTAILGILLVLRISHGIIAPIPFNMVFWHVEAGIAFSVIAIFHIAWHASYFKVLLKRN